MVTILTKYDVKLGSLFVCASWLLLLFPHFPHFNPHSMNFHEMSSPYLPFILNSPSPSLLPTTHNRLRIYLWCQCAGAVQTGRCMTVESKRSLYLAEYCQELLGGAGDTILLGMRVIISGITGHAQHMQMRYCDGCPLYQFGLIRVMFLLYT